MRMLAALLVLSDLSGEPLKASECLLDHMRVRLPHGVVCCKRPHKLSGLGAHRSEPAGQVTDAEGGDCPHPSVRRRPAEAETPALNERSIVVM